MPTPTTLYDNVGLVNFTLIQGVDKSIRASFSTNPNNLDISAWVFTVYFYLGPTLTSTPIISSATDGGIVVDTVNKHIDMNFAAADIEHIVNGTYSWDLRYVAGSDSGQILKGKVTLAAV